MAAKKLTECKTNRSLSDIETDARSFHVMPFHDEDNEQIEVIVSETFNSANEQILQEHVEHANSILVTTAGQTSNEGPQHLQHESANGAESSLEQTTTQEPLDVGLQKDVETIYRTITVPEQLINDGPSYYVTQKRHESSNISVTIESYTNEVCCTDSRGRYDPPDWIVTLSDDRLNEGSYNDVFQDNNVPADRPAVESEQTINEGFHGGDLRDEEEHVKRTETHIKQSSNKNSGYFEKQTGHADNLLTAVTQNTSRRSHDLYSQEHIGVICNIEELGSERNPDPIQQIATVPRDFPFNRLLIDIENSISNVELKKLKSMFRGNSLIGKRVLQEISSASDLFEIMRQRCFINSEDIVWLQAILQVLHRPELIERTIEYSNMLGNTIHFFEPNEQPENGFRYAKFHVTGKDFSKNTRSFVESLRTRVAMLVSVPPQFVIIVGWEPSASFMITFMIPELYMKLLEQLLHDTENRVGELLALNIDTIAIDKTIYKLTGEVVEVTVHTDEYMKFVNVFKRLNMTVKQLEEKEIECLQLSKGNNSQSAHIKQLELELRRQQAKVLSLCMQLAKYKFLTEAFPKEYFLKTPSSWLTVQQMEKYGLRMRIQPA